MSALFDSEALRGIGQDLELRGIKTFLLRCKSDLCIVEAGYQAPPALTPITLHYTLDDVEQLNRKAREGDNHESARKDLLSFAQIFWAIGIYVTSKGSRVLSISNTASTEKLPVITIEYERAEGDRVVDNRTGSAIYELCIRAYKTRGTSTINNIRHTRFSSLLHDS